MSIVTFQFVHHNSLHYSILLFDSYHQVLCVLISKGILAMMFLTYIHQTSNLYTSFSDTVHTMMRPDYIFLCSPLKLKAIHYIVVLYVLYDV